MQRFLATVMALTVLIAGCSPAAQPSAPAAPVAPKRAAKQVLRVSSDSVPTTASPESTTQVPMFWNQFDPLLQFDEKFNLLPAAAEKWELLPDNTWRFTLRKDLTFSNGDKLTAADVEFTVKNFIATKIQLRGNFPNVTDARAIDAYTVDLLTSTRDVSVLYNSPYLFVLPQKYYGQVGKEGFASKPVGSGPFQLAEYKAGDLYVYRPRSDPHPFRKPSLSEIRWQAVPEASAALAGIQGNELDLATGAFTPDQAETARRNGATVGSAVAFNASLIIDKNTNERNNTPLLNKNVRQAMNYAIDKEAITREVFKGSAKPAGQLSVPGTLMWDDALKPYPYDPAKAKALLAEAGYPNGFKMAGGVDFAPSYSSYSGSATYMLAVQDNLRAVGIDMPLNTFEYAVYLDRLFGRNGRTRSELVINSSGDANSMFVIGRTFYLCSLPPESRLVCVPEFERNVNLAYAELDPAKRAEYMRAANRAFVDELPAIFLFVSPNFRFSSPKLMDLNVINSVFWNLDSVYMAE